MILHDSLSLSWVALAHGGLVRSRTFSAGTLLGLLLFLTLLIGLCNEVGGDWFNYFPYLDRTNGMPFPEIFQEDDSLAVLLVWLLFAGHSRFWLPYRNLLLSF